MRDRLTIAFLIVVAGIPVGLIGASAFHPDGAVLFESEPLWTLFGLYAYLGILVGPPLAVAVLVTQLVRRLNAR